MTVRGSGDESAHSARPLVHSRHALAAQVVFATVFLGMGLNLPRCDQAPSHPAAHHRTQPTNRTHNTTPDTYNFHRHAHRTHQVTTLGGGGLGLSGLLQQWLRAGRQHGHRGVCRLLLTGCASAFRADCWPLRWTPPSLEPRVLRELCGERAHDAGLLDVLVHHDGQCRWRVVQVLLGELAGPTCGRCDACRARQPAACWSEADVLLLLRELQSSPAAAGAVTAALQCSAPRGRGYWPRVAESLMLAGLVMRAPLPPPLALDASSDVREDARRVWAPLLTETGREAAARGVLPPGGVPLDAAARAQRLAAGGRLAMAADSAARREEVDAARSEQLAATAAEAAVEAELEVEVGPEAMAAARRVRAGQQLSGDVWCLLSAHHFTALAWLPADDRDELLLLAALDARLLPLLDDAGRAQVAELLHGTTGEAVQRACVLRKRFKTAPWREACLPRLGSRAHRDAPLGSIFSALARQAPGG